MIGVDLFAGAGGMSCGARKSGVDVQIAVEFDQNAAKTYLRNHKPKLGVFVNDIRRFNAKVLRFDRDSTPLVVFGGPPCQGFSTSNQRTRSSENETNWLFEEFVRVVTELTPDWFVFENVKGILETEKGIFVERIFDRFNSIGYTLSSDLLHADQFGIPQKRARFFLVGSKHGMEFSFPKPTQKPAVTVFEALYDLPKLNNGANKSYLKYSRKAKSKYAQSMRGSLMGCNNHLVTRNSKDIMERYRHIPQGGNWEYIPNDLMENYTDSSRCHTGIYRRLELKQPSAVIGNYRKNMLIHPTQDRGLSVREAARLQSFPDDFVFEGSIGFQQQQVGNAVPPLLAASIFDNLITQN